MKKEIASLVLFFHASRPLAMAEFSGECKIPETPVHAMFHIWPCQEDKDKYMVNLVPLNTRQEIMQLQCGYELD